MSRQRRTVKNVVLTKKFHFPYMGTSIFISLGLLGMLHALFLYRFFEMNRADPSVPFPSLALAATVVAFLVGLLIVFCNVLAAHRIAGVHIKLLQTFNKVAEGDTSARLYFRKEDKLSEVQDSFNNMMDALEQRMGKSGSGADAEAETEASS